MIGYLICLLAGFTTGLAFYALLDAALPDPQPHCDACGEELKGKR